MRWPTANTTRLWPSAALDSTLVFPRAKISARVRCTSVIEASVLTQWAFFQWLAASSTQRRLSTPSFVIHGQRNALIYAYTRGIGRLRRNASCLSQYRAKAAARREPPIVTELARRKHRGGHRRMRVHDKEHVSARCFAPVATRSPFLRVHRGGIDDRRAIFRAALPAPIDR